MAANNDPLKPLQTIPAAVSDAVKAAANVAKAFSAAGQAVLALIPSLDQFQVAATAAKNVIVGLASGIVSTTAAVAAAGVALANLIPGFTKFTAGVMEVATEIAGLFQTVFASLMPAFAKLQSAGVAVAGVIGGVLSPAFAVVSKATGTFVSGVMEVASELANFFQVAGAASMSILSLIPGFVTLKGIVTSLATGLLSLGAAAVGLVPGITQLKAALVGVAAFLGSGAVIAGLGSIAGQVKTWAAGMVGSVKSYLATSQVAWAVAGAVDKVGEALGTTGKAAMAAGTAVYEFVKAGNQVIAAAAGAAANVAKLGVSLLRMPLDVIDTTISAIQINIARFVKLAAPGPFMLFERAVDDLYASIGHILVPVLNVATQFIRSLGSGLNGLNEDGQKAIQAIAAGTTGMLAFAAAATLVETVLTGGILPVIAAVVGGMGGLLVMSGDFKSIFDGIASAVGGVMNAVGKMLTSLMPVAQPFLDFIADIGKLLAGTIAEYANVFTSLAPEMGALTVAFNEVKNAVMIVITSMQGAQVAILSTSIRAIAQVAALAAPYIAAFAQAIGNLVTKVVKWISDLFGIQVPNLAAPEGELKDNTGAAARSVSTGDPADALRKARESAFQMGTGGSPASKTAENTSAIKTSMDQVQGKIDRIVTAVENFPQTVKNFVSEVGREFAEAIKNRLPDNPFTSSNPNSFQDSTFGKINPLGAALADQLKRLNPF